MENPDEIDFESLHLFDSKKYNLYKDKYPDEWWKTEPPIKKINKEYPLKVQTKLQHPGAVYAIKWSHDGTMFATVSTLGTVRVWDVETFKMLKELRDEKEKNIEEFYVCQWTPNDAKIIVAGKLQNRLKWSKEDEDNAILPCPIKVFDVLDTQNVKVCPGHQEEVLCLKIVKFKKKYYMLSTSQDGYILKWNMDDQFNLLKHKRINDLTTNIAISISFLPGCGNKYFLCSGDHAIKIYDFESGEVYYSICFFFLNFI